MSEEKDYDATQDVAQSGVRFASTEAGSDAIDYNCERLAVAVESFCGGRELLPPPPEDEDEEDPFFDAEDFPQPFIELIFSNSTELFAEATADKLEVLDFTFNVAFSLMFEYTETLDSNIHRLSELLSTQSSDFHELNLRLLCLLFNLVPAANAQRFVVMQRLLDLGGTVSAELATALFTGRLDAMESWIEKDWDSFLGLREKKSLYLAASKVAKLSQQKAVHLALLIRFLKLFNFRDEEQENDAAAMREVVDEAASAVRSVICASEWNAKQVEELVGAHIVCNVMAATPKLAALFELLLIVNSGDVAGFATFWAKNSGEECLVGVDEAALMHKMRLLTLCSMAVGEESTYSFEELIGTLRLESQSALEELIIGAIQKKLLAAKLDYANAQLDITRARQRTLDKDFWETLEGRLSLWRQNTNTVIQIIHTAGLNKWRQQYIKEHARKGKQ